MKKIKEKYIVITKRYGFFDDTWKFYYGIGESILRLQTFPCRRGRKNYYRFYFDAKCDSYKSFYAYSEYKAIEKSIQIIRKNLVKRATFELEVAKKDWKVLDSEKAKFYNYFFENRKIL